MLALGAGIIIYGGELCKGGVATGYSCGIVASKEYSPGYIPNGNRFLALTAAAALAIAGPRSFGPGPMRRRFSPEGEVEPAAVGRSLVTSSTPTKNWSRTRYCEQIRESRNPTQQHIDAQGVQLNMRPHRRLSTFLAISSALAGLLFLPAVITGADGSTDMRGGCPYNDGELRQSQVSPSARHGGVVPGKPRRMQLCRYYYRDDRLRLAPTRSASPPAVARQFARKLNQLPSPARARKCEGKIGYVVAYFSFKRKIVPVTIRLGGCRLVTGRSRNALAPPRLVQQLVALSSDRDAPFGTR